MRLNTLFEAVKTLIRRFSADNVIAESGVITSPTDVIMSVTSNQIGGSQRHVTSRDSM